MNAKTHTETILPAPDAELVSFREDSITVLARLGMLDADQIEAAYRFRNALETVIEAKRDSIGFREWQSPGPQAAQISEQRAIARRELQEARNLLGAYLYALVGRCAGEGYSVRDLFHTRRERDSHYDMLKISLQQLAALWIHTKC
jgi:hypothetical protein